MERTPENGAALVAAEYFALRHCEDLFRESLAGSAIAFSAPSLESAQ